MKRFVPILIALFAAPAAQAEEPLCRSVSTSWEAGGHTLQTRISESALNGCKRIWQTRDGIEREGVDCNCDLVIDGMEAELAPPPSAYQRERLLATCRGPASRDTQTAGPQTETPRIRVMQGASSELLGG